MMDRIGEILKSSGDIWPGKQLEAKTGVLGGVGKELC